MTDVKIEFLVANDEETCRGCLSVNRHVKLLGQNIDLYLMLLDNKTHLNTSELKILLCWECTAILKKIKSFQNQIRRAQYELGNLFNFSLSSLTYTNKVGYDAEYDGSYYKEIKEEKAEEPAEIEVSVVHVKEELWDEPRVSDYEPETSTDYNLYNYDSKPKRRPKSHDKQSVFKTPFDMSKMDEYISEVSHSIKDLELFQKEQKDLFKRAMPRPFLIKLKRFLDKKNSDFARSAMEVVYPCSKCKNLYPSLGTLKDHWEEHTLKTYQCSLCKKHYANHSDMQFHFKTSHSCVYTCNVCGITCCSLREYYSHYRELHDFFTCDHCRKRYKNKFVLERHIRLRHSDYICKDCNKTFQTLNSLVRHNNEFHVKSDKELSYCVECNIQFDNIAKYTKHLKHSVKHRKSTATPCPICNKVYNTKYGMTCHYNYVHLKKTKFYCDICDRYFLHGTRLRDHRASAHNITNKPQVKNKICPHCGKAFKTNAILNNHIRTHTGERPFHCSHCTFTFAQRVAMVSHMSTVHKIGTYVRKKKSNKRKSERSETVPYNPFMLSTNA